MSDTLAILQEIATSTDVDRKVELCRQVLPALEHEGNTDLAADVRAELGASQLQSTSGDREANVEEAIAAFEVALEVTTRERMPDAWVQNTVDLAYAYSVRPKGDKADNADRAIDLYEHALEIATRDGMPNEWAQTLDDLGAVYLTRIHGDRSENIERALDSYRHALEIRTPEAAMYLWASTTINLATAYLRRIQGDSAENIEHAAECVRKLNQIAVPRGIRVSETDALRRNCKVASRQLGEKPSDAAVTMPEETLSPGLLAAVQHAAGKMERALTEGGSDAMDDWVAACQAIVDHPELGGATRVFNSRALNALGEACLGHFRASGDSSMLDRADAVWLEALDLEADPDSRDGYWLLSNLAQAKASRYDLTGENTQLDESIRLQCNALKKVPLSSPDYAALIGNLIPALGALVKRYERDGTPRDLDEAISILRAQILRAPPGTDSWRRLVELILLPLGLRLERFQDFEAMDEAITASELLLEHTPAGSESRTAHIGVLAALLDRRYGLNKCVSDLDRAIQVRLEGRSIDPKNVAILAGLGPNFADRYQVTKDIRDLDDSIATFEDALAKTAEDSSDRAGYLNGLSGSLSERYLRTGRVEDLQDSARVLKEALSLLPAESINRPVLLGNLGQKIRDLSHRTDRIEDIDEAIGYLGDALRVCAADFPGYDTLVGHLAGALSDKYAFLAQKDPEAAKANDLILLEEASRQYRELLDRTPTESPDRPMYLNNSGNHLRLVFEETGDPAMLNEAIEYIREALAITPDDYLYRSMYLNNLGNLHRLRHGLTDDEEDHRLACEAYDEACRIGSAGLIEEEFRAAINWGRWAFSRRAWEEASIAYGHAVDIVDRLYKSQLLPGSQQAWLHLAPYLPGRAAYSKARAGHASEAVVAMERGRARSVSEALMRDRADLKRLRKLSPELHTRYLKFAKEARALDTVLRSQSPTGSDTPNVAAQRDQARGLSQALDEAIEQVRQVPGYETFLTRPGLEDIGASVTSSRPTVYLIATEAGCMALVCSCNDEDAELIVEALALDNVNSDDLERFLRPSSEEGGLQGYIVGQVLGANTLDKSLRKGLAVFGEHLIAPLAERLRQIGAIGVNLIPGGLLALLPLHAAPYRVAAEERTLLDEFDVNYVPSARVYGAAARSLAANPEQRALLAGAANPLPNPKPLRFARFELSEVMSLLDPSNCEVLFEENATKENLLTAARGARYIHLACHGNFELDDPMDSRLQLSGGEDLTLREIISSDSFEGARLVVLSACQTAVIEFRRLPNEAMGLPAAFLQAGVPGVIGSLWSVPDVSTALLMIRFYKYQIDGCTGDEECPMPPARALRYAQQWIRDTNNAELTDFLSRLQGATDDAWSESSDIVSELIDELSYRDPDERPFAHPYYWAAFAYFGV